MTSGPTPSITTSAWPSSSDITAVIWSTVSFWAGVCTRSMMESSSSLRRLSISRLHPVPEHLGQHLRVEVGGRDDLADLLVQIAPQPGHRGELHPVGLLVQADPEAEVGRVDVELALDGDDVRRHQQQPTARLTVDPREERVELAEHLRREIAEQCAHLDAGHPGPDPGHRGVALLQLVGGLGVQRGEDLAETVQVGLDPARPVDHQHRRRTAGRGQPGDLDDVRLGPRRALAQLRDGGRRAGPARSPVRA